MLTEFHAEATQPPESEESSALKTLGLIAGGAVAGFAMTRWGKDAVEKLKSLGYNVDVPQLPENASGPLDLANAQPKSLDRIAIVRYMVENMQTTRGQFRYWVPFVEKFATSDPEKNLAYEFFTKATPEQWEKFFTEVLPNISQEDPARFPPPLLAFMSENAKQMKEWVTQLVIMLQVPKESIETFYVDQEKGLMEQGVKLEEFPEKPPAPKPAAKPTPPPPAGKVIPKKVSTPPPKDSQPPAAEEEKVPATDEDMHAHDTRYMSQDDLDRAAFAEAEAACPSPPEEEVSPEEKTPNPGGE